MAFKEIMLLLLGWLLGILGPGIVTYISSHYKSKELRRIIVSELIDIKKRISNIPLFVYPGYGILDENIFNWIKVQTNNFSNITDKGDLSEEMINKFKQIDNPEFVKKIVAAYNITEQKQNPAFGFKKISTSIIESNIILI